MPTITPRVLVPGVQLTASNATYYTATNVRALLDKFTVLNTSASAATLSMWFVHAGGSASDATQVIKAKSIAANTTDTLAEVSGHILEAGGFVVAVASAATALSLRVSGREWSN